jgi:hypothetical protein
MSRRPSHTQTTTRQPILCSGYLLSFFSCCASITASLLVPACRGELYLDETPLARNRRGAVGIDAAMNPTTIITPAEAGPSSPSLGSGSRPASPAMTASQTLRKPASSGRLAMLLHPGRSRSGSSASQEATTITAYADDSGGNSGRSTPEQRRRTGKGQWTS